MDELKQTLTVTLTHKRHFNICGAVQDICQVADNSDDHCEAAVRPERIQDQTLLLQKKPHKPKSSF